MGLRLVVPPSGQGSAKGLDEAEFLRGFHALIRDGREAAEYRALPSGRSAVVDPTQPDEAVLRAVRSLPQDGFLYHGINPPRKGLGGSAKVGDIVRRSWLLVDVDPRRPKDVCSTGEEKEAARAVIDHLVGELCDAHWPNPVIVDSGNGYHAYYRVFLPADDASRRLVKRCLAALAKLFDSPLAQVDVKVCDAPRIAKAPGTWSRKGPDSPARPWRLCRVLSVPPGRFDEFVTVEQLEQLAGQAGPEANPPTPAPAGVPSGPGGRLRVPARRAVDRRREALRYVEGYAGRVRMSRSMDEGGEGRNNTLNDAVFYCSRFIGILTEGEAIGPLRAAAESVGCPGIEATIRSAMEKGKGNPRGLWMPGDEPQPAAQAGKGGADDSAEPEWMVTFDDVVVASGDSSKILAAIGGEGEDKPQGKRTRLFDVRSLDCLLSTTYPPPRWIVDGIMSEGLTLLVGSPKQGKSLMALNLALTIAGGGKALADVPVDQASVLYLSLEDKHRRVKDRAIKMLKGLPDDVRREAGRRLHVCTDWPRQSEGGLELLDLWLAKHKDAGLVIIDVWNRFQPQHGPGGSAYRQDAEDVAQVKGFCDRRGIAGLIVHHDRKVQGGGKAEEDFVASISGTQGIAGSADGIMVLVRNRNEVAAELKITGRDVEERVLSLEFSKDTLSWKSLGGLDKVMTGKVQEAVIEFLKKRGTYGASIKEVAEGTGQKYDSVSKAMSRMLTDKILDRKGHSYRYPFEEDG